MSDHAVIVPTSVGPVGGVVSAPHGPPRAALLLLQGAARGGRAGLNAVWTRLARQLAELGVVVLRVDYAGDGESYLVGHGEPRAGGEQQLDMLHEVLHWFRERAGAPALMVAGACYGGRLGIYLAHRDPSVRATLLVVPYLRPPAGRRSWMERLKRVKLGKSDVEDAAGVDTHVDPEMFTAFGDLARRGSNWILLGEKDPQDAFEVKRRLGLGSGDLDIDVVPAMALYPVHHAPVQAEVTNRLLDRVVRLLPGLEDDTGSPHEPG